MPTTAAHVSAATPVPADKSRTSPTTVSVRPDAPTRVLQGRSLTQVKTASVGVTTGVPAVRPQMPPHAPASAVTGARQVNDPTPVKIVLVYARTTAQAGNNRMWPTAVPASARGLAPPVSSLTQTTTATVSAPIPAPTAY